MRGKLGPDPSRLQRLGCSPRNGEVRVPIPVHDLPWDRDRYCQQSAVPPGVETVLAQSPVDSVSYSPVMPTSSSGVTLQHARHVVRPGRAFLRQITDLLRIPSATKRHHHITLNCEFRADLQWWVTLAEQWNGVAIFPCPREPFVRVNLDASGSWGCGAWSGWFQLEWSVSARGHHICFKELYAGLVWCAVWGRSWHGCRIRWWCDNQAAVHTVNRRSCRDKEIRRGRGGRVAGEFTVTIHNLYPAKESTDSHGNCVAHNVRENC